MDAEPATQPAGNPADQARPTDGTGEGQVHQIPPQVDLAEVSAGIDKVLHLFHLLLNSHSVHDRTIQVMASKLQEMETNVKLTAGLQHVMAQIQVHEQCISQLRFELEQIKSMGVKNAKETERPSGIKP